MNAQRRLEVAEGGSRGKLVSQPSAYKCLTQEPSDDDLEAVGARLGLEVSCGSCWACESEGKLASHQVPSSEDCACSTESSRAVNAP